jgi:hypothetical protein
VIEAIRKEYSPSTWWETESEKDHIAQMGDFTKATKNGRPIDRKARRLMLLLAYRDSIPLRKKWGNIDKTEIVAYVTRQIEEIQNGGSQKKSRMEEKDGRRESSEPGRKTDTPTGDSAGEAAGARSDSPQINS